MNTMTEKTFFETLRDNNSLNEDQRDYVSAKLVKINHNEERIAAQKEAKTQEDLVLVDAMLDLLKEADEPMTTSSIATKLKISTSKVTALYKKYMLTDEHVLRTDVKGNRNSTVKAYNYKA